MSLGKVDSGSVNTARKRSAPPESGRVAAISRLSVSRSPDHGFVCRSGTTRKWACDVRPLPVWTLLESGGQRRG